MESVETRLYVPGQTISYPQFTANGETRFVDPVTGRVFDLKRDENWNLYIEYTLHRGETFEEEFQFVDSSVTAGSQNTFEVSITTRGTIPANSSVQTTTARVTYAVWAEETEAPVETETAAETETETVSEAETETAVETESETETETAAATESETETETESETEIVTETETAQVETENAGIFDYEDDKAQISVEILNLTPENQGLRFAVNSIGEESKTFEKIAEQIMEGGSTALVDMLAYYIGVVDETGKAPAENELIYQITMKFKTPVLSISDYLSEEDKDSTEGEVKVYVEGTEIPADIQKNKKGAITGISFITDKVGNTAVALTSGLQTTADITMKTESNEYFMKLEDAKQTNLKVDMSVVKGEARNDVQNAKASAKLTYYDADGNEVEGITPAELQGFGVGQGSYLGNSLNNINGSDREKVVYVKISMEAGELADTSFKFGEDDPSYDQGSRTLTFKLAKRTFEPDEEITTKKGITYIAVGPNHQYGLTGPLGLVSNFHAIGFSKVTNGAHTNGNILTKKLNYKNNFGTNGLTGEISYIRSFESIAAGMMCGDGSDDILVLGKDIDVTWAGNTFYLNGQKLTRPMTIYQDTEEYQYLDIDTAKEEAESLSSQFGALPDTGVTFENKTFKVSNGYSGMTVINVGHGMLGTEALAIEGLHNQSSTSLLINVRVPKGTEEITIPNVSINGTSSGSGEVIDFSAGKVIWNVVYEDGTLYTGKVSNGGAVAGTILVPDGKVHAAHNWNGSLIADEIEITGETHRTDFTGVLGFGVSKVLKGRDWKLSDRFQFELSTKEGTPMPIGSKTREGVQKKIISVTYSNRSPSFGGITYGTADIGKTYQYTLKELEGNIKDIIYSEAVYTIQVSIQSNNGQGLLIIKKYSKNGGKTWEDKMPEEDVFEFTNVSGVEFKVKKKYNSTYPGKNDDNVFKFVLKGLNEAPMPQKDENAPKEPNDQKTIIVTSSEEVSFDSITYKEDGTYKYEISEVKGKLNGVTYDEKVYDVKVEVSKDENGTGVIKVSSREKGAEDAEYKLLEKGTVFTAEFTNTYDDASAEIKVQKNYNGTYPEGDNAFKFILKALNGAPLPKIEEEEEPSEAAVQSTQDTQREVVVTNGEPVSFGTIEYSTKGTYYYEVSEVIESLPGVTYDETVYEVKVDVTGKEDGTKTVKVSYRKQSKEGEPERDYQALESGTAFTASFTNRYEEAGSAEIRVKKNYNGTYPSGKDAFKFILTAKTEKAPLPSKTEVTVGDGNEVSFGKIKYDKEGTYEYEVREVKGEVTGVTYDEAVYEVRVVVTGKEDGTKDVVVSSRKVGEKEYVQQPEALFTASFTNTYTAGEAVLKAKKNVEGNPLEDSEFTFKLYKDSVEEGNLVDTQKREGAGDVTFKAQNYHAAGTYTYKIVEEAGNVAGYSYDGSVWTATVVVEAKEGKLTVSSITYQKDGATDAETGEGEEEEPKAAEFTNIYTPGEAELKAKKNVEGNPLEDSEFTFKLYKDSVEEGNLVDTQKREGAGDVTFKAQNYHAAGTYTYKIVEEAGNVAGYSYDGSVWTATVVVEAKEGKLIVSSITYEKDKTEAEAADAEAAEEEEPKAAEFTNIYTPGEAELKAKKNVAGNPLEDSEFTFKLYKDSVEEGNLVDTQKREGAGDVTFKAQNYHAAGTYTYKIVEEAGNVAGYSYDGSVWTATVVVEAKEGKLTVSSITYQKDGATDAETGEGEEEEPKAAEFTNIYTPGEAELKAKKNVAGNPLEDSEFTFKLYKDSVEEGNLVDTQKREGAGDVTFKAQNYHAAGTYTYKIVEEAGNVAGYSYDGSVWTATVVVEAKEGKLTVSSITYQKDGATDAETGEAEEEKPTAAIFTNTYKPAKTTAVFTAEKKVEGPTIADDTFTFELYKDKVEGTPLDTQTITGNGTVDFAEQTYEEAGTYFYKIVEKAGTTPGYTYDASVYTVIVEVTDIGGKLESKVTYVKDLEKAAEGEEVMPSENALFTNTYKPAETTAVFTAEKKVEGLTPADSTFTFELYKNSVEAANLLDTQNITGAGITAFAEQTYDAAGIYTYKIVEKAGEEAGYTYDTSVYTVTVEVTDIGGKLVSKVTYAKDGADNAAGEVLATAVFTNTYNSGDTKAVFTAKKTIKGDPQKTSRFTFELYKDSILEANLLDTKSIRGEGTVDFAEQTYNVPGTYTYKIVEKAGETAGYSYDGSIYTVTVEVTDIGGKLTNTVTYVKDDAAAGAAAPTAAEFINTYDAGKTNAVLTATKTIKGTPAKDSKFTFELYKDSVAEENLLDTKSITGTGSVNFKEQNYKAVGTYTYKIVEKAGEEAGYIYDTSVYTATVVVTDKGGELARKITYTKDGAEESKAPASAVFENTYDAGSTEAVFEVTKAVNGTPKKAGTFTFELYKDSVKEANLLDTQTIKGQGRAEFAAQTYNEPGTYTYKIIEKAGNEEGYTYDNSVYTVTVTVTDEGGRLDNTVAYENENGARRVYQAAEFVNEYKEKLGRIVVTKQVVNQTLDGEVPYLVTDTFYFALFKDEALTEMSDYGIKTLKLKNQSEGKVVFEDVDFGEYYLAETDKDGNPVTAPPFIEYFVTIEDPLCEVTKAESTVKKIVKNAKLPDNYGDFGDGEMIIDKYVLNGSEEYTVTDTFYFTLFRDEELKIPYEQFETKKLDLNDEAHGTVTFEKLPYGVYYLAETDADGKPVGDGFDYEVKIEKKQFTISETNKKETIRIDNCITPDTPGGKHTPKTGDDTLIWPYVTMMLAALVAGTGSIFGKRRRKRSSK